MPLIMDDDMDIDDLFGDGAGLSMPARPPTREILQKVDAMRRSACTQAIAWSRMGLVVSINAAGYGLELRNIRCHPDNGSWDLCEPTSIQQLNTTTDGGPLEHLCFNPSGSELAVVDAVGRVTIITVYNALNKPTMIRPANKDPVDDLHALAGCHWLNTAQRSQMLVHGPAILEGNKYKYEHTQILTPALGPVHPILSHSCLICLTVNGVLRFMYPQPVQKNTWQEVRFELESIVSSDDLITHAAFCNEKSGTLLVAYATTNRELRLVRVSIDWGISPESKSMSPIFNPTIDAEHLAVGSWLASDAEEDINSKYLANPSHAKSSMVLLSYLEILPPIFERVGDVSKITTPPTIVAVRSHLPTSSSNYSPEVYSTLDRWSFQETTQSLHPAFEQLSFRGSSTGSTNGNAHRQLKLLTCLTVDKIILSIQHFNLAKNLCIAYSDGSIDYRDRETLAETFQHSSAGLQRLTHLCQAGFSYPTDEPCVEVAMSPTLCSAVQLDNEGKIKWKRLEYRFTEIAQADAQRTAANSAYTIMCANAIHQQATIDDLLDIAFRCRGSTDLSFQSDLPPELARILTLRVDYSGDQHHDALVRNSFLQSILAFQNSLGYCGDHTARTFSGKFAWIALQLRHAVVIVSIAYQFKPRTADGGNTVTAPLEDPEIILAISGLIRWSLDLMSWIIESLLDLRDEVHSSNYDLNALNATVEATRLPTLHLLFSSATRSLLENMTRRIAHFDYVARKTLSAPTAVSPALRDAYRNIANITSKSLIKTSEFERVFTSIDVSVREAYTTANLNGNSSPASHARNSLEIKLLLCFPLPAIFKTVHENLFKVVLPSVLAGLADVGELYFTDFSERLGIDVGEAGRVGRGGRQMDTFYRRWIPGFGEGGSGNANANRENAGMRPLRIKRCARCASCTEDSMQPKLSNHWLIAQQRRCSCSGFWNLLLPGKSVA